MSNIEYIDLTRPEDELEVKDDLQQLHQRSLEEFDRYMREVKPDQWGNATPCSEWSVRDLVNHIVNEDKWTVPLIQGATIEEVGDRFDGDLLGDDPLTAWEHGQEGGVERGAGGGRARPHGERLVGPDLRQGVRGPALQRPRDPRMGSRPRDRVRRHARPGTRRGSLRRGRSRERRRWGASASSARRSRSPTMRIRRRSCSGSSGGSAEPRLMADSFEPE